MAEALVLTDPQTVVPEGRFLWTTEEMYDPDSMSPTFSMGVVAQVFFFRSTPWLRQKLRLQKTDDQGRPLFLPDGRRMLLPMEDQFGPIDPPRTSAKHHAWRLWDIERFAHFLTRHHQLDTDSLLQTIRVVKIQAKGYGYLS